MRDEGQPDVAERPLADEAVRDEAMACCLCNLWLNGPGQYNGHIVGKRHRRNSSRQLAKERAKERNAPSLGIGCGCEPA